VFFEKVRGVLEAGKFIKQDRFVDRLIEQGFASTDVVSALLHIMHGGEKPDAAPAPGAKPAVKPLATKPAVHTPAPAYVAEVVKPAHAPAPAAFAKVANKPKVAAPEPQEERPAFQQAAAPQKFVEDAPVSFEPSQQEKALFENEEPAALRPSKQKFQRAARTGREPNMTTLFFNVGRKQLITPADIVGKVAGVTRLPANVVGAMDIHQRHTLVDVTTEHVELILQKMKGIRVKNIALEPALATDADRAAE
jgi:ATP-dependent RNA helicase DeaD